MPELDYPDILTTIDEHRASQRTDSAAFLLWYLLNYYRLDEQEAQDAVCDQNGDKGIDGIFINEAFECVDVFQAKIAHKSSSTVGDKALREFEGSISQIEAPATIEQIIKNNPKLDLSRLLQRLDLANRISGYTVRGIFLSNVEIDSNGQQFLDNNERIEFVGRKHLLETYISDRQTEPLDPKVAFDVAGYDTSRYVVDSERVAYIAPIKGSELAKMPGIGDQSLFAYNVRGTLGNTKVNRDIIDSIKNVSRHKTFPLFHNGITIISNTVSADQDTIEIEGYNVVNGAQSLTSLYVNRQHISGDLRILTKIIKMDVSSELSELVTRFSNNQNGTKSRDFRSNDRVQVRLKNEFERQYDGSYWYEIKRGETGRSGMRIPNELAGLFLMAFDLQTPWSTHRKYQVFEDRHSDLFARPEVTADRIVLCQVIMDAILAKLPNINNQLFAKYALTKFFLLYVLRQLLSQDEVGNDMIQQPMEYVRDSTSRNRVLSLVSSALDDVIVDLNAEIDDLGEDFDYRDKLRDENWCKNIAAKVIADHQKLVNRGRINSLTADWAELAK